MFEEFKNAFNRQNNGHVQLIIINVVVFVLVGIVSVILKISKQDSLYLLVNQQFIIPPTISEFATRPWTMITYAFMHSYDDYFHIIFNMIGLYWFGRLFVEYLGSAKLVALYILGALTAATFYLLLFNTIPYFKEQSGFSGMVGASGALFAVMVGAATLLPDYTFFLLLIGPVRIKYIAAVFIFISYLGTIKLNAGGNIAHLGGALMGYIYIKQLQSGVNWGGWITTVLDWIKNLFKPRSNVKVTYRKTEPKPKTAKPSKASQEEIDAILDKISDRGYESLSKDEKEKLFNASKK